MEVCLAGWGLVAVFVGAGGGQGPMEAGVLPATCLCQDGGGRAGLFPRCLGNFSVVFIVVLVQISFLELGEGRQAFFEKLKGGGNPRELRLLGPVWSAYGACCVVLARTSHSPGRLPEGPQDQWPFLATESVTGRDPQPLLSAARGPTVGCGVGGKNCWAPEVRSTALVPTGGMVPASLREQESLPFKVINECR